jgi:flavin reductase (DIM6/NTAB) family NADH-FMN oxidoreductase RutF
MCQRSRAIAFLRQSGDNSRESGEESWSERAAPRGTPPEMEKPMDKMTLGSKSLLYPMPVTIVGAEVEGKPNFLTVAYIGVVNANPGMVAFGSNRKHFTNRGILANRTFSINIPSQEQLEITDYIGLYSGAKVDKSHLFEVFYGKLKNAPMITSCPLNLECRVTDVLDRGGIDEIFIGEIIESYCEEKYLTGGYPDVEKMKPAVFSMYDNRYFSLGKYIGQAWSMGKNYKSRKSV